MGRIFLNKLNLFLENKEFTPHNARFAEGMCSDEINESELVLMENYWKGRFKFGGLAGYCHGGKTGIGAVSHHVPNENGK